MVRSGEEETHGRPYHFLQLPESLLWQGGGWPLLPINSDGTRGNGLSVSEEVQVGY